jgi:HD-GYP domain-containing protein (c-di-GMP phosphodiesterase class II)
VHIRLLDFLSGLSGALDLMSPEVVGHHKRVAYLASRLAHALGVDRKERTELFMAAVLHDVGGFTLQSRLAALSFEADGARHAEIGYRLLRDNPLLDEAAVIVRHHHTPRSRYGVLNEPVRKLQLAGILNLADRVDVLTLRHKACDPTEIMGHIRPRAGYQFDPAAVEALGDLAAEPGFWAPLAPAAKEDPTRSLPDDMFDERGFTHQELMQASTAFSHIIDFRSRFTATHSRGVAETAVILAEKSGMEGARLTAIRLAGNLHDIGKLAVPSEIIDKPGPLNEAERAIMERHPELGETILSSVPGLEDVTAWASQHHEKLNGTGYPNRLSREDIPLGSRVMALADIFTALREDRPYRPGIENGRTMAILEGMATGGALDPELVSLMRGGLVEIDACRRAAQASAAEEFRRFYTGVPAQ